MRHKTLLPFVFFILPFITACGHPPFGINRTAREEPFFSLPGDAPEQDVIRLARAIGLSIPRIHLIPSRMAHVYASEGKGEAMRWCAAYTSTGNCTQALSALARGPFISTETGIIWLNPELTLPGSRTAPMLQELARQIGPDRARQLIAAHEIGHHALRFLEPDLLRPADRNDTGSRQAVKLNIAMLRDEAFYEAFCHFFGVALVVRASGTRKPQSEHQRISEGLAESLRTLRTMSPLYLKMAAALETWARQPVAKWKTLDELAVHAADHASQLWASSTAKGDQDP